MPLKPQHKYPVFRRKGDPNLYLFVEGGWYGYNPMSQPLGEGAMGTVWQGFNVRTGEKIAIKKVKERFQNVGIIRDRARLEASMAFRHPHLIEMIGCCMIYPDRGPIWMLSNFVFGDEIDKFLKNVPEGESRIMFVSKAMCQVLDALEYIHSKGITHRDIKPSNIMVEDESNVRLMDLGIARLSGGSHITSAGSFIGTPQYAAPEQIMGQEPNETTDIYALGVTFYELLTGVNPYDDDEGDEKQGDDDQVVFGKQLTEVLPKSEKVPKKLYKVLLKATEKDRSKRYQTAEEFRMAIQETMAPQRSVWHRFFSS